MVGLLHPEGLNQPRAMQATRRQILQMAAASATVSTLGNAAIASTAPSDIIEPDLPIVDPHHHLWDIPKLHYLFPELLRDLNSGHNIVRTVFIECQSMYRADGPEEFKPIGEVEFVNGVAAMSASGGYGPCRAAKGIIGHADLSLGAKVEPVLEALIAAGGSRFRGIRDSIVWDAAPLFGGQMDTTRKDVMENPAFRAGFARLKPLNLSFEAWCFHPQLGAVARLAEAFPNTTIILNHLGSPLGVGPYAGHRQEVFKIWQDGIKNLAKRQNVVVKIGGLGMDTFGSPLVHRQPQGTIEELAAEWRPYVETAVEAFGPDRGMFESNFPVDAATCDYQTIWNVFKTIAKGYSATEKTALFQKTADRVYRLT